MKILVSGALAFDKIMNFPGYFKDHILPDKIHNINVSFFIEKLNENYGGPAGNISYNLALLDEKPVIFSTVGNDFDEYKKWLGDLGVDLTRIKIIKNARTALATMITDKADNQIASFCPGAMFNPCPIKYNKALENSLAIISPGNMYDMVNLSKLYIKNKIPYVFDPGQQIPVLTKEELRRCIKGARIFISNDYELSMVAKKTWWSEKEILGKVEILITTLGARGSIIKTKNSIYKIKPAKPKKIVDPTGAGDAYRAGFIKGLIEKWSLQTAGEFAGTVACYAVENYGTQNHKYDFKEAEKRYNKNFNKKLSNKKI
jgi:adenosine kinase